MKSAYYPGCSLHSTAAEYDWSVRAVLQAVGVELTEVPEWNCCGATPAHASDEYLSLALPLRNLARAGTMGLDRVIVPCAACYNALRSAQVKVAAGNEVAREAADDVARITSLSPAPGITVLNPVDLLVQPDMKKRLSSLVKHSMAGLRVATYYGCLLVRPSSILGVEHPEQPMGMDDLMEAVGAEAVTWSYKTDCCGGTLSFSRADAVGRMVDRITTGARDAGADVIVTACPLCQANLETRQSGDFPILYFTELLGMALGVDGWKKWIRKHLVTIPSHILPTDRGVMNR